MKIALSRFKNIGSVGGTKYVTMPTGLGVRKFVKMYDFTFAYLNESIDSQITNAGNTETSSRVIATMDPRFEPYMETTSADQVSIGKTNYNIANVAKDDTQALPVYTVTLKLKSGY